MTYADFQCHAAHFLNLITRILLLQSYLVNNTILDHTSSTRCHRPCHRWRARRVWCRQMPTNRNPLPLLFHHHKNCIIHIGLEDMSCREQEHNKTWVWGAILLPYHRLHRVSIITSSSVSHA